MDPKRLGKLGVWCWLDSMQAAEAAAFAKRLEGWGYSMLWLPEAVGRDPFALAAFLGAQTQRLVFATGIANLYARDPMTMETLRKTMGELTGGRFVLGIGVSHAHLVTGVRKHEYGKPVATMRAYLEAMKDKPYVGPPPPSDPPVVIAALRQKMLGLARDMTSGAHPYFTTPEHTRRAREILGPDRWLAPEMMCVRETDPAKARALARAQMKIYLGLPNYQNNLRWIGFGDADLADGGSDRLVDAIVTWGDTAAIRSRIEEHWKAGADHVCIQPFRPDGKPGPDEGLLADLAPGRA